jgi:polyhydroxyalkanoate synthesis regulator phasin
MSDALTEAYSETREERLARRLAEVTQAYAKAVKQIERLKKQVKKLKKEDKR